MLPLLFVALTAAMAADSQPTSDELARQGVRCKRLLDESVVRFYLDACVDKRHGGYLELYKEGKFVGTGQKFLTMQGRQLWFFSVLAESGIRREEALAAAKSGYSFLTEKMKDPHAGGYYSRVTDDGQLYDTRKHVYLHSFALYGLVAYHRASGDPKALEAAKSLFRLLEARARDKAHGGYLEFFYHNWSPITDPKEPGFVGAIGTKTYNSHLHIMEAFADLYRAWPDATVRDRLHELVLLNVSSLRHPAHFCNIDGWKPDWSMIQTPANLRASYGHDVECAWLVLDAASALGLPASTLRGWAEELAAYSVKHGYDSKNGGFYYSGPLGQAATDRKKEWWVQAEALVSMLELFKLTSKKEYYDRFCQTLDFVEKHQIAPGGGWYASRRADGGPMSSQLSSQWQGAYHSGRALLRSGKLLDELGKAQPAGKR